MSALTFTLELKAKPDSLLIKISDGGPKRILYRDTLLALAKERGREAILFLAAAKFKSVGILSSSSQASTTGLNEILLPRDQISSALKLLASAGALIWKGKRLFVDPFSPARLRLSLSFEGDGALKVEGVVLVAGKEKLASACELLFSDWFISDGVLQFFQQKIESRWLKLIYPEPSLLRGEEKEKFIEEVEGEEIELIWKNEPPVDYSFEALPFLVLKDRSGGFADLWFDYPAQGKVAAHEPAKAWRKRSLEQSWEKDLLETGFKQKLMANSHYYCPLDKMSESLSFLLDLGWKVLDVQGRRLVKQTDLSLFLEERREEVVVRGRLSFGEEKINLEEALKPLLRRDSFLALSEQTVGLIDRAPIETLCGDLLTEEITSEGIHIKKSRVGLLEPLLDHPSVEKSADFLIARSEGVSAPGSGFIGILYPYQQEGLKWLSSLFTQGFSGLLADEMGLGKTVQVIALLSTLAAPFRVLIVVPTSLLFNWKREIEKFLPETTVYVHSGGERAKDLEKLESYSVILTSYAILRLDGELLQRLSCTCIVLDEAQQIKNPDSQTARQAFQLKAPFRLAITGTPIENRWEELWSLFYFLMPELLGTRQIFTESLTRVPAKVKRSLKPYILRRRKEEVAKDLPPKIYQQVWIDMPAEQKALYNGWAAKQRLGLLQKIAVDGSKAHRMEILEAILRLRQIAAHPLLVDPEYQGECGKFEQLMADLEEAVQEKRKVLIYSQFTQMLQLMESRVRERGWAYLHLDGSTSDRETPVRRFQEDPEQLLFFISLKAGGVGLNLTAADTVILYDPWWNDAQEEQAIDRAHRLGRKSQVVAKRYVTVETIEEKMVALKKQKSALAASLLESESEVETAQLELDELYAMLSPSS
ncbi:MAG: DEAD/DEAH box helicase [Chlamydiales bacterium]|nr:DEAD/DEAH box helicase [Chlamydiales bacterium]